MSDSDCQIISQTIPSKSKKPSGTNGNSSKARAKSTEIVQAVMPTQVDSSATLMSPSNVQEGALLKKKPRPRPKPRARNVQKNSQTSANAASTIAPDSEDEYARFIYKTDIDFVVKSQSRSRQPSASTSRSPEQAVSPSMKQNTRGRTIEINEDDSDSRSSSDSPRSRKRIKKVSQDKTGKKKAEPALDLGVDISSQTSDSGSDAATSKLKNPPKGAKDQSRAASKRKARELTPTAEIDPIEVLCQQSKYQAQLQQQQTFSRSSRPLLPTYENQDDYNNNNSSSSIADLSTDIDPVLQAAVLNRLNESKHSKTGSASDDLGYPVRITVEMVYDADPRPNGTSRDDSDSFWSIQAYESPMHFEIPSKSTFYDLYNTVASSKGVPLQSLVLEDKDDHSRIWPSSTPRSKNILSSATFKGYRKAVYEIVQARRRKERLELAADELPMPDTSNFNTPAQNIFQNEQMGTSDTSVHIELQLRHQSHGIFKCHVKKTSTFRQVLKYYMKQHNIPLDKLDAPGTQMTFDDEPLDLQTQIGDSEVENEDLIEVQC